MVACFKYQVILAKEMNWMKQKASSERPEASSG
jgi:hypothetical protein